MESEMNSITKKLTKLEKDIEFIKKMLIERDTSGKETSLASEKSLAKYWLTEEEDEAWEHLQKEI
jgi:hypothetical protein